MADKMTATELTAAGVPEEHHATALAAMEAGFSLSDIIVLVTKYGPILWQMLQDILALMKKP